MHCPACLVTLALLTLLFGCTPDEVAMEDRSAAASDTASHEIVFRGDFKGPLGLQLWSLRDEAAADLPGTLARVYAMGFREVETAGTYGRSPEAFRRMLDEARLRATSMHLPYERFRDSLDVALREAETLGVEHVGLAWIPHDGAQPFTEAQAREAAARFNAWGAAARARGLQFFYHPHGFEFRRGADGATPFDVLVAETNPGDVSFEMDVFWVTHPGMDPVALLRRYPDRWTLMHIKDRRRGTPTPDHSGGAPAEAKVPVGTGMIDYPAVLRAAQEIGLARYYLEDESTDPRAQIPQSITFLESVSY